MSGTERRTRTVVPAVRRISGLSTVLAPLFCARFGHRYLIDVVDGVPTLVRCQRCPAAWDLSRRGANVHDTKS